MKKSFNDLVDMVYADVLKKDDTLTIKDIEGNETFLDQRDNVTSDQCMISSFCGRLIDIGKVYNNEYLKALTEEAYYFIFKDKKRFSSQVHRDHWNIFFSQNSIPLRFEKIQCATPETHIKEIVNRLDLSGFDVITSTDITKEGHIISVIGYGRRADGNIDLQVHDSFGDLNRGYSKSSSGKGVWYKWELLLSKVFKVQNTLTYIKKV
jgi:hypothetical protein